jgi:nucleoid DNA-binding protein
MAAKKAAKKATPKKATPKKATAKKAPAKKQATAVKEPMTKAVVISEISNNTGLNKKQVNSVIDELAIIIERHIKKRAPGKFILPGLIKVQVKQKPATKARKGINPFTGEETTFKAKPARRVVKVTPLKKLKEMAE